MDTPAFVTPVIDSDDGVVAAPELSDSTALTTKQIGKVVDGANAMSWQYEIDTNELASTGIEWFKVKIVTQDLAGHQEAQYKDPAWLLVCQDADIPQNTFNISSRVEEPATINWGGLVTGFGFDDDGVKKVYIAVVPNNDSSIQEITNLAPKDWADVSTDTKIVSSISAADQTIGASVLNWSVKLNLKGGDYRVFAVPYDISDVYRENYYESQYFGKYYTNVHVASQDDPVITIDGTFRGATILKEGTDITGSFYDNNGVTRIIAWLDNVIYHGDNVVELSSDEVELYANAKEEGFADGYEIVKVSEEPVSLTTGQSVTKYNFKWAFNPGLFKDKSDKTGKTKFNYHYKSLKLNFKIYDKEGNHGDDSVMIYGDSEQPKFESLSPSDNPFIMEDTIFTGVVSDNVDVEELTITTDVPGFDTIKVKVDPTSEEIAAGVLAFSDPSSDDTRTTRSFSVTITPTMIMNQAPELVFTLKDQNGLENKKSVFVRADNVPPKISVTTPHNNEVLFGDVTFSGAVYDNFEVVGLTISSTELDLSEAWTDALSNNNEKVEEDGDYKGLFRKTFSRVVAGVFDASKSATITLTATDNAGNSKDFVINVLSDSTLPTITLISPENNTIIYGDVTFDGYVEDNFEVVSLTVQSAVLGLDENWSNDLVQVQGNRKTFSKKISGFSGTEDVEIKFIATDKTGNVKEYVFKALEDTILPQFDKTTLSPKSANIDMTNDITFSGVINDNIGVASLELEGFYGSGDPVFDKKTIVFDPTNDADGKKRYTYQTSVLYSQIDKSKKSVQFKFTVKDLCGNVNEYSYYVKDDSVPPSFYTLSPESNTPMTMENISITGQVEDNVDVIQLKVEINGILSRTYTIDGQYKLSNKDYNSVTKKYYRTFEYHDITLASLNYKDAEIVLTAQDESFNETSKTIIIKG
ncbi:MAG: hypothetical protein J6W76_07500, partial [Spirochaetales bacterium]|nr:hypothetical protein [Spirochaetales bacterium]